MYPRRELKDPKKSHHKLTPLADGLHLVLSVQDMTVLIETPERSVELVLQARFSLAPPLSPVKNYVKVQDQGLTRS